MKQLILFFTAILLFSLFINLKQVKAFSAVLGAKTIGDKSISINGYQVDDPENPIMLDTDMPTFSGYTIPNVRVLLIIRSEPIERETLSDATGYWSYTLDEPLPTGEHTLSLKITDQYDITSEEVLTATFTTPEVKGKSITPPPSPTTPPIPKNPILNYLTISLMVIGSLVLLGMLYLYLAKKIHST